MRKKNIIAATSNNETYDFLFNVINAYKHWNFKRFDNIDILKKHVLFKNIDLFIIDSEFATTQIQEMFLSSTNKTPYIVMVNESDDIEALSWIHKGASGFLHVPINETSEEAVTFVVKSMFRCAKIIPARIKQIMYELRPDNWFYFRIYSDIHALEQFQRYFTMLYSACLREEDNRTLYLALNEVCINAIEWGNKKDLNKNVEIYYKFESDKVILRVIDEGPGFDPKIVPNPMELGPLEIVKIRKKRGKRLGGYGLALVRKIMDRLEFRSNGNEIYMEKKILYTSNKRNACNHSSSD